MKKYPPNNMASSVKQKLLNISKERKIDHQLLLTRYGLERFLYRLCQSKHKNTFILKGALLFLLWDENSHRPTRDADLLGTGTRSLIDLKKVFQDICKTKVEDDGIHFDPKSVKTALIKEDQEYEGVRVTFEGKLGQARISIQVDIGFGDVISPRPQEIEFPALLDFDSPIMKAYPPETVIAEKFQAMVQLGVANSRMKDFYDIWFILTHMLCDAEPIKLAIMKTFKRRKTEIPNYLPFCFSEGFFLDANKQKQWTAFLKKNRFSTAVDLKNIIIKIRGYLLPLIGVNMNIKYENFSGHELLLFYQGLKALIENGTGYGFHNNDMGHPAYVLGAKNGDSRGMGDSPEKNDLFQMISSITKELKLRDPEISSMRGWYDFSEWKSFCKFAVDICDRTKRT